MFNFSKSCLFSIILLLLTVNFTTAQLVFAGDVNEQTAKSKSIYDRQMKALEMQEPELAGEALSEPEGESPVRSRYEFIVRKISLEGPEKFIESHSLLTLLAAYNRRTVSEADLHVLLEKLNKRQAEEGYVTTRAVILPQNIKAGNLSITIIPGRIHAFLCAENTAPLHWQNAFPASAGDILNIRDLEQGLENLRRPCGQDVKMKIAVAGDKGESDVILYGLRGKPWGLTLTTGNHGNEASGKYRGQVHFTLGNPFSANDNLTISLGGNDYHAGTYREYRQNSISYSIPYKNYFLSWRYYRSDTGQPLAGVFGTWPYRSKIRGQELTLQGRMYRDGKSRVQGFLTLGTYHKKNYIGSAELRIQRVKKTNAEIGISHDRYFSEGQMNTRLSLSKGLSWLGAQDDAFYGNAFSTRGWIWNLNFSFLKNMCLGRQQVRYRALFHGQQSSRCLCNADEISIGGLYTVRGFTGEQMFSGKSGWYLQQELQWQWKQMQPYVGFDAGKIYGTRDGKSVLYGLVLGIRGGNMLFYDVSAGVPLIQPDGWKKNRVVIYAETGIRF